MRAYSVLPKNPYFEVLGDLNAAENRSDNKVAFLVEADFSSIERVRAEYDRSGLSKPTYTALIARAVALALREHPHVNRLPIEIPFWRRIVQLDRVHISVAVERDRPGIEQAVFVGTIRDTDEKSVDDIARELRTLSSATTENCPRWSLFHRLVERIPNFLARWILSAPKYSAALWLEHRGGAVLISSPAKYGVDAVIGTWLWPIGFSFGLVALRPKVVEGNIMVRPTCMITMSFDRRIIAGAPAARFMRRVICNLEQAESRLFSACSPPVALQTAVMTSH